MAFFNEFPHSRTYDSDLGWLIGTVKKLVDCCESMTDWKETHEKEYQELKDLYNNIMAGEFPQSIKTAFQEWMSANALDLVGNIVKSVFFGLTDSGYFIAYIPDSWDDIIFNTTGLDITVSGFDYGHLTLTY